MTGPFVLSTVMLQLSRPLYPDSRECPTNGVLNPTQKKPAKLTLGSVD